MARIVSLGSALQDIYLIDHDDLKPTEIGGNAIFERTYVFHPCRLGIGKHPKQLAKTT